MDPNTRSELVYVLTDQGRSGGADQPSSTAEQIHTWVLRHCAPVADMDGLSSCAGA